MKTFETKLVDAIRKKREAEGLSIRALSAVIGISFSTLARIERGEGLPDNNSKIRLLEWLGEKAEAAGLKFDNVAFVHFRAAKNVQSSTVRALLRAADGIRRNAIGNKDSVQLGKPSTEEEIVALSKEELEKTAEKFRKDLNLAADEPLDSLKLKIEGVEVHKLSKVSF
ncbi:helix-turn-helix domain-containing protein [Bradyrhizobium sp. WSM1417]|uniref:helix-turn-helix domain-containing protein n=1 Tax=Bradyrhizobium sp. WSM1417 TaxID=754500 RepID=UPI0004810877|nr:helix-turn-helix transcriptional regulator [Bradyrhizobium sp. WSM1417]